MLIPLPNGGDHVTITRGPQIPPSPTRLMFNDYQIRRMLADAPVGHHPLLEAAFGWHERRPYAGFPRPTPATSARYLPLIVTHGLAASRFARLLSTLTWPILTPIVHGQAPGHSMAAVEVPAGSYHRVNRALNTAWRDRRKLLATPGRQANARHAAQAVWRIAVLLAGCCRGDGLAVRVRTPGGLQTLTAAADLLDLTLAEASPGRRSTVLLPDHGQSLRLLEFCFTVDYRLALAATAAEVDQVKWGVGAAAGVGRADAGADLVRHGQG
jgi:hypothetical protein